MRLTFVRADGQQVTRTLKVAPTSRTTVSPATIAGLEATEFSTIIESDEPVLVDRTITWGETGRARRSSPSIAAASTTWFMANGATHSGFDLFYVVLNPTTTPADVHVRYLLPQPRAPLSKTYRVAPLGRLTIWVNEEARTDIRLSGLDGRRRFGRHHLDCARRS